MKLKKIASLMLAGIMAVSMLAGCKTATEPTEEPEVTPVTGVAATVNSVLTSKKDKINLSENEVVTGLMKSYFTENPLTDGEWTKADTSSVNDTSWFTDLNKSIDAVLGAESDNFSKIANNHHENKTYTELYVLNTSYVSMDNALRMVGQKIDDVNMPSEAKNKDYDYSYTGTISAIEAESEGGTESVWVIAVSITQTSTKK